MNALGFEKPTMPPPDEPLRLSGTSPGLLDPSQTSRLLKRPLSRLSFATFDPFAASADNSQSSSSSSTDKCRSQRIVIETTPDGQSTWRWIPSARKESGVEEEGEFVDRVVSVCGTLYRMSQDQWDIYKLDPNYDCCIRAGTGVPTISLKGFTSYSAAWASNTASMRTASPYSSSATLKPDTILKHDATMYTAASPSDHESDRMSVDVDAVDEEKVDVAPSSPTTPKRATRELPRRRCRPYPDFGFQPNGRASAGPSSAQKAKRSREERSPESHRPAEDEDDDSHQNKKRNNKFYAPNMQKRARTLSPNSKNRKMYTSKLAREKAKAQRLNEQKERHKQARQQSEQPPDEIPPFTHENAPKFKDIPEEDEEEMAEADAESQAPPATEPESVPESVPVSEESQDSQLPESVDESIKKLKEMNLNRPQEREREKALREDPYVAPKPRRAKTEAPSGQEEQRRRKFEAAMQEELKRKHELEEARRKEALRQQELERKRAESRAKAAREREIRNQEWMHYWDHQTALDRYKKQSVFFDKEKFSQEENPLMFTDIPWPTLSHPLMTSEADLEYESVTQFLEVARMYMQPSEFNSLVNKSRVRFHPDRWSNRRLLEAVVDVNERNAIQTIITTVSQAMNYAYDIVKPSKQA